MRFFQNLVLYCALFVPLSFLLGFLEGALRGEWPGSVGSLGYQLQGWVGSELVPLLLSAVPSVAGIHLVLWYFGPRRPPASSRRLALTASLSVIGTTMWLGGNVSVILFLPFSFLISGLVYGRLLRVDLPPSR